jgi:hypothetical protein
VTTLSGYIITLQLVQITSCIFKHQIGVGCVSIATSIPKSIVPLQSNPSVVKCNVLQQVTERNQNFPFLHHEFFWRVRARAIKNPLFD